MSYTADCPSRRVARKLSTCHAPLTPQAERTSRRRTADRLRSVKQQSAVGHRLRECAQSMFACCSLHAACCTEASRVSCVLCAVRCLCALLVSVARAVLCTGATLAGKHICDGCVQRGADVARGTPWTTPVRCGPIIGHALPCGSCDKPMQSRCDHSMPCSIQRAAIPTCCLSACTLNMPPRDIGR